MAKETGRPGYGVEIGIRSLFLQFYYDLSDRQLQERLHYDMALRWFCGFNLNTETPDEGVFSKLKNRTRYRGLAKVQLQVFLEAIVFNVKRLLVLGVPPLFVMGA